MSGGMGVDPAGIRTAEFSYRFFPIEEPLAAVVHVCREVEEADVFTLRDRHAARDGVALLDRHPSQES